MCPSLAYCAFNQNSNMSKMNGSRIINETSGSSSNAENSSAGQRLIICNGLNDCDIQLNNGTTSSSSAPFGGARPKTREFEGNIANGVPPLYQSAQTGATSDSQGVNHTQNELSPSGTCVIQNQNKSDTNREVGPVSQQRCNLDVQAGPSYSYSSRNNNDNGETDASRLAAVCAASSLRAMAERARQAEHGTMNRLCSPADSDSSSDTGNDEGLSGDECCIYTYKGDQNADLSNGLLGLSLPQANEHPMAPHAAEDANRDGGSSPEMDFLEMDFDPDPLGEQDSIDEDNVHDNLVDHVDNISPSSPSVEEAPNELGAAVLSPQQSSSEEEVEVIESSESSDEGSAGTEPEPYHIVNMGASTSSGSPKDLNFIRPKFPSFGDPKEILRGQHIGGSQLCPVDADNAQKLSLLSARAIKSAGSDTEPMLEKQKFNLYSALYHSIMANNLILDEEEQQGVEEGNVKGDIDDHPQKEQYHQSQNELPELEKTMIWTEREACHKQVSQIAVSACGAAAVSNVLSALNISFTLESVHEGVATRLRAEKASLPTYLFSRAAAGAAHNDLIRGLSIASDGAVYSRFFHMHPERDFSLSRWLAHWIKEGAVPIATLNIQRSAAQGVTIPDSWHHQMIFGVSHRGIYLTNPLECVSEEVLHPQLCSPSVLLIRRQDIVSRWTATTDLCRLATSSDIRWKQMNVLGQVVNILREANARPPHYLFRRNFTSHISIPASYCSGVLLTVPKDSPAATQLKNAPELPLRNF